MKTSVDWARYIGSLSIADLVNELEKFNSVELSEPDLAKLDYSLMSLALEDPTRIVDAGASLSTKQWARGAVVDRFCAAYFYSHYRALNRDFWSIGENISAIEANIGASPSLELYKGAIEFLKGDRKSSYEKFRESIRISGDTPLPRLYVGAYSVPDVAAVDDFALATDAHPNGVIDRVTWIRRPGKLSQPCIYAAGDSKYFLKFGKRLTNSIRATSDLHIHFHIVNCDKDCNDELSSFSSSISISTEKYGYLRDFTFYATIRFMRLSEIINSLETPVFVTDLDMIFKTEPDTKPLHVFDICVRNDGDSAWFPW